MTYIDLKYMALLQIFCLFMFDAYSQEFSKWMASIGVFIYSCPFSHTLHTQILILVPLSFVSAILLGEILEIGIRYR